MYAEVIKLVFCSVHFLVINMFTAHSQKQMSLLEDGCTGGLSVLVTMCGKSVDLLWLCSRGHSVTGIEISPLAVQQFFTESSIPFTTTGVFKLCYIDRIMWAYIYVGVKYHY